MANQIIKNTAHELVVKMVNSPGIITLADGLYNGVTPSGYSITSIRWSSDSSTTYHLEVERGGVLIYDLSGNGHMNLIGAADYTNSTDPINVAPTGVGHHFTIIISLSKID